MKTKKLIIGVLIFSLVIEIVLTALCFFTPTKGLELFGMTYNKETAFLAFIIAWFLLLVSAFIFYLIYQVKHNNSNCLILIQALAI